MAADHFCLRWNNYQSNMVSELDILRSEEHLVDVTLSCEGQKFRAHKVILSACSAYFRNVFKENPCEHPVVILKDVCCEDVEALLSFVYQGVVYVSEKKLASFLQTAELLQIKGLTGAASSFKDENLSEKAATVPNKAIVPPRKVLPAVSPPPIPPTKRRKGAPVRICKPSEEAEDSDNNSQKDEDDQELTNIVKQEKTDDIDNRQVTLEGQPEEDVSMEAEGDGECDESITNAAYPATGSDMATDNGEDGEVRRDESTLLERSLVSATMSRSFDSQGPFSSFPAPGSGSRELVPTNLPLLEQINPTGNMGGVGAGQMTAQPCPLCPKIISNKSNLLKHMRIRHTDEYNPAYCMICNKLFKNKYSLRAHINIYHKFMLNNSSANQQPPQQLPQHVVLSQTPQSQQQF